MFIVHLRSSYLCPWLLIHLQFNFLYIYIYIYTHVFIALSVSLLIVVFVYGDMPVKLFFFIIVYLNL